MQPDNALVLVIEDERAIRRFLRASLTDAGYRLNEAASGDEGLKLASNQPPDLVLLDLGLPDLDGQEILSRLREWYTGPIIVLSARDQELQKIKALDQGADDYVTKPFSIGELLARIRTALRHSVANGSDDTVLAIGDLHVDLAARVVRRDGKEIHLTPLEYKLLTTLMKQPGKVLTHRYLLREVWGPDDSQENHYLRVFVASLRRKLEDSPAAPRFILTEQGVGYRFAAE
jgi:two-component system KDP operon response regulator KdpE